MHYDSRSRRRNVLKALGGAGITGLAGCIGGDEDGDEPDDGGDPGDDDTETPTDTSSDDATEPTEADDDLEDSLTIYANTEMQPLAEAFEEATGVDVTINVLSGPRALGRFTTEYEQGTYEMDVLLNAATQSSWSSDLWAEVEPGTDPSNLMGENLRETLEEEDAYGKTWPFYGVIAGFVYNENAVSDPPTDWEAIPDMDARIGTAGFNTDNVYRMLLRAFGEDTADELYPQIYDSFDVLPSNHTAGTEQVIGGQIDVMVHTFLGSSLPDNTGPVQISFPAVTANHVEAATISDEAPHPNAAEAFVQWVTSQEGQQVIQDIGAGLPAFPDMEHGHDLIREALNEYDPEILQDVFTQEEHDRTEQKAESLVDGDS